MSQPGSSRLAHTRRGYAIARSVAQLRARPFASLATLIVLSVVLTLPTLLLFAATALDGLVDRDATRPSLTAYLQPDLPDLEGAALASELGLRPGIAATRYLSRDEALATLAAGSDLTELVDGLGSNPLPGSIVIYPDAPNTMSSGMQASRARVSALAAELEAVPGIERIQYDLIWVERLAAALEVVRIGATLLAVFLTITALLVIGNTIRLELLRRRDEREVADLLGADRAFRDRPFLYTGALYGLLGGVAALVLSMAAWAALKTPADVLAGLYGRDALLGWPAPGRLALIPLAGAVLGLAGALISLYGPSRVKIRQGAGV